MTVVTLTPISAQMAADINTGRRHSDWAADFPTEGDVMLAGLACRAIAAGHEHHMATAEQPWLSMYLIACDGVIVGGCGFKRPPDELGRIEIGYGVAQSHWGRGVATSAVRALLDLAEPLGLAVTAETEAGNIASQRVLVKAGFAPWQRDDVEHLWWLHPA